MGSHRASTLIRLVLIAAVASLALPATVPARKWRPHMFPAEVYAKQRRGIIAFAVRTRTRAFAWHGTRIYPSASLLKPMLLVAYLSQPSVRHRPLSGSDRALLRPMITHSDNAAATAILGRVGAGGLRGVARRAGMQHFTPVTGIWGNSQIDAEDQARFFFEIDHLLPARHRAYGLKLLAGITPSQRWGIGQVGPRGWRLYFKGGWGSGTGRVDHQSALLVRGRRRVSLSILTMADGTHGYGKETLRGIAKRLLRGLAVRR